MRPGAPDVGEAAAARGWRAAGWILLVSGVLGCCAWLEAASTPVVDVVMAAVALGASVVIGLAWLLWAALLAARRPLWSRPHVTFVALLPAVGLATFGLLAQGVPLAVRFELSRGAFEDVAVRVQATGPVSDRTIGLYEGVEGHVEAGVVLFYVPPSSMVRDAGFAYCPNGCPTDAGYRFTHFSGPWFLWTGD